MTKQEIIDALAPSVKPEIIEAITAIFKNEERLSNAAKVFSEVVNRSNEKQETSLAEKAISIEQKIDHMRSREKYIWGGNNA